MKKVIFMVTLFLTLSSCVKQQQPELCKALFKSVTIAAQAVATTLQCQNTAVIAADLSAPIAKLGLCAETSAQSTLSDFLCPQLSTIVATAGVNTIPATWGCTGQIAGDIVKQKIQEACVKLIK